MVGLKGTHQDKLAGHDSKDGLGVHQVGVAKVVHTALREDMSTSLEPHRLIDLHTGVLGHQLRGQAAQSAQQSPTSVGQLGLMYAAKVVGSAAKLAASQPWSPGYSPMK